MTSVPIRFEMPSVGTEVESKEEKGHHFGKLALSKLASTKRGSDDFELPPSLTKLLTFQSQLLRGMLSSADHPFRTTLSFQGFVSTSAAGVLNATFTLAQLGSAGEWSAIDTLFDEFFVHGFDVHYDPFNLAVTPVTAAATFTIATSAGAAAQNNTANCGAITASLFGGVGAYTSAAAMTNNFTHQLVHTARTWDHKWTNQVRFNPRGVSLAPGASIGWAGWTSIGAVSDISGLVQIRTVNDQALGDGAHSVTIGSYVQRWDVSFRSRS